MLPSIGVSSLVDAIIGLEYYFSENKMRRQLVVIKSRGSAHSMDYCQMHITGSGIRLHDIQAEKEEDHDKGGLQ